MTKRIALTLAIFLALALPASATATQHVHKPITLREAYAASAKLAHEWEDERGYTVRDCSLAHGRGRCTVTEPVQSSITDPPRWVLWEDSTIVDFKRKRVCAWWEGPTIGHTCLQQH